MKLTKILSDSDAFINAPVTYVGVEYVPFSHKQVVETLSEQIQNLGYSVKKEYYLTSKDHQKVVGRLDLGFIDADQNFCISWRNSLDGSMAFGIAAGSIVNICSNSNIWGSDLNYKRKHTGNSIMDINNSLESCLNSYESISKMHVANKEKLANIKLSIEQMAEIVGKLYLIENIISERQITKIKKELEVSSFDYGVTETAWNLYNHCTYILKEVRPSNWHTSHINLCNYFEKQFKL